MSRRLKIFSALAASSGSAYVLLRPSPPLHVDTSSDTLVLSGPWHVQVLGVLPLRSLSRLWGAANDVPLPEWARPFGFRLYGRIFGCNFSEVENDLKSYACLGDFFYRRLKDGVRKIGNEELVSPADGTVLHFGNVTDGRVEQVKGVSYSLQALLGTKPVTTDSKVSGDQSSSSQLSQPSTSMPESLDLAQSSASSEPSKLKDASISNPVDNLLHDTEVIKSIQPFVPPSLDHDGGSLFQPAKGNALFFAVVYLAPGDYHHFHSPCNWIVSRRRHFPGDLFSVSPFMAARLPNLFVLNERVALLGKWKFGDMAMIPVGATNVGSIKINFDKDLRTNHGRPQIRTGKYTEAVYHEASPSLGGQPLQKGEEMGGFCLGSTVVLVFEAPRNFKFSIEAGQRIKQGEAMGDVL